MVFGRFSKAGREKRQWSHWQKANAGLIAAAGLPASLTSSRDVWNDFLGYGDHFDFDVDELAESQREALRQLLTAWQLKNTAVGHSLIGRSPHSRRAPHLTRVGSEVVQMGVVEIATGRPISWASLAAAICVVLVFVVEPPAVFRGDSLFDWSVRPSLVHVVLGVLSAGFGFSALRQRRKRGRIVGGLSFLIGVAVVYFYFKPHGF